MPQRFTERSREILALAQQEAQRLNHAFICPEHVLIGMLKEGSGVAADVLRTFGMELATIRGEVEKLHKPGSEMVTMGKLPHTDETKILIEQAGQNAQTLKHSYIGTEHLLLGVLSLIRAGKAEVVDQVFEKFSVDFDKMEVEILKLIAPEPERRGTLFKNPAGPSKRRWCNASRGTLAKTICETCGTVHPDLTDADSSYIIDNFLGHDMVEECCGKAIDTLYQEFGEVFSLAFLEDFSRNPTDPRFTILRSTLQEMAGEARKKCVVIQREMDELTTPPTATQ